MHEEELDSLDCWFEDARPTREANNPFGPWIQEDSSNIITRVVSKVKAGPINTNVMSHAFTKTFNSCFTKPFERTTLIPRRDKKQRFKKGHKIMTSMNNSAIKQEGTVFILRRGDRGKAACIDHFKPLGDRSQTLTVLNEISCPTFMGKKFSIPNFEVSSKTNFVNKIKKSESKRSSFVLNTSKKRLSSNLSIEPMIIEKCYFWVLNIARQKREIYRKLQLRKYFDNGQAIASSSVPKDRNRFFNRKQYSMESRVHASKENSFRVKTDSLIRTYGDFNVQNRNSLDKRDETKSSLIVRDRFSVAGTINDKIKREAGSEVSIKMPSLERLEDMKRVKYTPYTSFIKSSALLEKPYRIAKIPHKLSCKRDMPSVNIT